MNTALNSSISINFHKILSNTLKNLHNEAIVKHAKAGILSKVLKERLLVVARTGAA
jgi:hypothetical protein